MGVAYVGDGVNQCHGPLGSVTFDLGDVRSNSWNH